MKIIPHPLSDVVLDMLKLNGGRHNALDVTIVSLELGSPFGPDKTVRAYRIVAGDVLYDLWQRGKLAGHSIRFTSQREGGFGWFTHPKDPNIYVGEETRDPAGREERCWGRK